MTNKGIVYDLQLSPYIYENSEIRFYFSSKQYLTKFEETVNNVIANHCKKFGADEPRIFSSLILAYFKTEKRGFYFEYGDEKFTCLEKIIFDGVTKINLTCEKPLKTLMLK